MNRSTAVKEKNTSKSLRERDINEVEKGKGRSRIARQKG